jgi:single-stranded-DNA-specific exonuclease
LGGMLLRPVLHADLEIPFVELRPELLRYIEALQPTGFGNRQAYFISRDLQVTGYRQIGKEGKHLRLVVSDGRITYDAVAFNLGYWADAMPATIDILYSYEVNEYNGKSSLQLNVRDLKRAGSDQ